MPQSTNGDASREIKTLLRKLKKKFPYKSEDEITLMALQDLDHSKLSSKAEEVIEARASHEKKWRRYQK